MKTARSTLAVSALLGAAVLGASAANASPLSPWYLSGQPNSPYVSHQAGERQASDRVVLPWYLQGVNAVLTAAVPASPASETAGAGHRRINGFAPWERL